MSLPTYPKYKDSGVEWLGAMPAHWEIDRLKRRCNVFPSNVDKKSVDGEATVRLCNYTDVYYSESISLDMPFMEATASEEQINKFTLRAGDTIFTKDSETAGDIGVASFVGTDMPGVVCGYHLSVARPYAGVNGAYVKRLFDAHYTKARFAVLANGLTRVGLNQYAVDNIELPWPPLEEQGVIVAFLGRETAKIDALIAEQEKLLALLAEKRQATISHAVTRGLNPDVQMKDSGILWLGEVPAHWDRVQLGRLCLSVSDGPHFSPRYVDDGVMFLSARNVRVDGWSLDDAKYVSEEDYAEFCKRVVPEVGDVLYTKGGTTGIAKVVDFSERFQVWVHVAVLKIDKGLALPDFVAYSLNSVGCYEQSQLFTRGATNQDLGLTRMVKIWLALPPLEEQIKICAKLDQGLAKVDMLKEEAERAITLLRERRSAIVSAVVTGKIDVRGRIVSQNSGETSYAAAALS